VNARWVALGACCAAAAVAALSCGGPTNPTPPVQNDPPKIVSLTAAAARVEAGETVKLTAEVTDAETPAAQLSFEWSSSVAGSFSGTGAQVTWRPSTDAETPADASITLTVVERYNASSGGRTEPRENRVSSAVVVHVNNSVRETTELALQFLTDFSNSAVSAETCVRNFTDKCKGKQNEYADIVENRATRWILDGRFHVDRVELNEARTRAVIWAPCQFTDYELPDGTPSTTPPATCLLTAVYEPYRWWLCNSNWCDEVADKCSPSFRGESLAKGYVKGCS